MEKVMRNSECAFWESVDMKQGEDSCWNWKGGLRGSSKYGMFRWDYRDHSAHRIAFMLARGPIPPRAVIRHTCDNPLCCKPSHLRMGTQQDNINDREMRGRSRRDKNGRYAKVFV